MREIKFRAWIREGEWDEAGEKQAYKMCYDLAFEDFEPINDLLGEVEHLMQYTGLKDRNGREIYEGDIIAEEVFNHKAVVTWGNGCWLSVITNYDKNKTLNQELANMLRNGICEIAGNIYENPELPKV